jgi:dihydroorotase
MSIVLANGLLVGPDGVRPADVRIDGTTIDEIGAGLDGDEIIDCAGAWIGPGLVDIHVHLREPGQEWKEDIATGSAAAAAGGFTAVVAQPNTEPAIDSGHVARHVIGRGREVGLVDVAVAGAISLGRAGEHLAHLDDLWDAGARLFSDDGDTVADAGLLRRAMEYIVERGGVIAQHAEDPGLARGGHMHEGAVSARLGMAGLPAVAEEVVVARDLRIVELTGCRYHVQHVSTVGTIALVAAAKADGLPVTAEVAPHHLSFDHRLVESMDGVAKMYPPLRTPDDRDALREALRSGVIDAVATDHAPHSSNEKDVPFEEAPRGVIGLETAAAATHTDVGLDPNDFFDRLSVRPAAIAQLDAHGRWPEVGGDATLTVFHPEREVTVGPVFRSKSSNSPWVGQRLRGAVLATLLRGTITHREEA